MDLNRTRWLVGPFALVAGNLALAQTPATGAVTYTVDPSHTYPTFFADHHGVSTWSGKFNKSSGTIVLDRTAHKGTVSISIDINSINFGLDKMNEHALSADMFNAAQFPTATYQGTFSQFNGDVPTQVQGTLTLHGVTKPVTLTIERFACKPGMGGREVCGGDATTTFNRADFGISFGVDMGMDPNTKLVIQVEATRA